MRPIKFRSRRLSTPRPHAHAHMFPTLFLCPFHLTTQAFYTRTIRDEFRRHASLTDAREAAFQYGKGQRFLKSGLGGLM